MKRLIEKGLMFGNLVEVSSPVLIDRYNRALKHLTGKTTALPDFHIDITGYSPEVGDELGDQLYLNPNGVNRQFILLTTEQKRAPLLGEKFSTTRPLLRRFIDENEPQLFALTAQDAVAGELDNSVFELTSANDLFDIRKITVRADTTRSHVANARELAAKITRFRTEGDAWLDDVLIAQMIALAKETGDVTRNPVDLTPVHTDDASFWTAHFGGAYLFRAADKSVVIACDAGLETGADATYGIAQSNAIARFLDANGMVEPIIKAKGINGAAILKQKMDFILIDAAAALGQDVRDRRRLRQLAQTLGDALPDAYKGLAEILRWAEGSGPWPRIPSDHPAYFYMLRAASGPNRDLVNRLLAELAPLDVRQLFVCHKQLFYRTYAGWSDAKKEFVANFLEAEYQVDKAGARAALFGDEPGMDPDLPPDDLIAQVGPWGAVRRRR